MAKKNTPLINELLHGISEHPDFDKWFKQKKLPQKEIKSLCDRLKTEQAYQNQPGRFYSSAIALTEYIYKSWFAIQKKLQQRIEGKQRWLNLLKSDSELETECGQSLEKIEIEAKNILDRFEKDSSLTKKKKQPKSRSKSEKTLFNYLFDRYNETTDPLNRCVLAYLLKNNCQIPEQDEDLDRYQFRRQKKEIEIKRLQTQLQNRLPKDRDLSGQLWLKILGTVNNCVPQDELEAASWQADLLRKSPVIPFPISYETNTDLIWSKDGREHFQVRFNGLGKQHQFEIRCDKRQLCWFQRFFEDGEILRRDREKYSSALFTLRSARLLWREGKKGKGNPWEVHTLYLQCSVDTHFWTAEGTKQIASDKSATVQEILNNLKEKAELTPSQVAYQKRQQSTFTRIKNPFPRPQKPVYQGDPSIIMGVSLGLEKPATIAIVNVTNNRVLAYRSIKQLLGKNYKLLNHQQRQKQKLSHLRHQAQKTESNNQFGESELGEYIDRLIAKAIVEIAQKYRVSSIVLPHLKQIREITDSELMAKAQRKIPGYKEGQKKYIKQYRCNIHQWSYGRLIESIEQAAAKIGIDIEQIQQSRQGTPQEQAKQLAISAYNSRLQRAI